MNVEIVGRHTHVDEELREFTRQRLQKLERFVGPFDAHVMLETEKHRHRAEIHLTAPQVDFAGADEANDLRASIAAAADKLERQARRHKTKRHSNRRGRGPRRPDVAAAIAAVAASEVAQREKGDSPVVERQLDGTAFRIFEIEQKLPLLTVDAAATQLQTSGEPVLFFRDETTDLPQVVVRRRNGDFDVIRPAR